MAAAGDTDLMHLPLGPLVQHLRSFEHKSQILIFIYIFFLFFFFLKSFELLN